MTDREIIAEILNIKKFNYTLADNEVFEKAIQGIKVLSAIEDIKTEIQKALDEDKATDTENAKVQAIALMWCLEVIDKHIGGK